ncbi:protein MAINTENANCE OF MERISTEMS-like [Papaver somniferum]|uniref:protein MAINTENANCE OF MERISTEMS-like n=1 Tax=Papaver somniferum TaxID=3469 RepID=UPI000E706107|nr:protein MAINTENANCE OF MERISTEMS-like [Papaver somniferum]
MGLVPAVDNLDRLGYDRPLCSAFAERYYGETDTLNLPFEEMTITPNDAKFITGLSIEGKSVKHKGYAQELAWDKIYAWTKEVFQWYEEKTKKEMLVGKSKQRIFHLSKLRENFMGTKNLRAQGKELLQPFDKMHEYSWGTAMLAHSLKELRKASRASRNQLGGNMDFLQAWIYLHFQIFTKRAFENKKWDGEHYGDKYNYRSKPKKQKRDFLNLRRQLDNLTTKDIVFDPYKQDLAKGKGKKVGCRDKSEYCGPLFHPRGYVMYNPTRVARQCGYVQKIPKAHKMFNINWTKTKSYDNDIVIVHKPLPSCDY